MEMKISPLVFNILCYTVLLLLSILVTETQGAPARVLDVNGPRDSGELLIIPHGLDPHSPEAVTGVPSLFHPDQVHDLRHHGVHRRHTLARKTTTVPSPRSLGPRRRPIRRRSRINAARDSNLYKFEGVGINNAGNHPGVPFSRGHEGSSIGIPPPQNINFKYGNESLNLIAFGEGNRSPRSANNTNPFLNIYDYRYLLFASHTGRIVVINSNGTVTTEKAGANSIANPNPRALLNIYPVSNNPTKTVFQSLAMGMYLCLDKRGMLYSSCNRNEECEFNYTLLSSNYNVIESFRYRQRYLTLNADGTLRRARKLRRPVNTRNYFLPGYIPWSKASAAVKKYFSTGTEALQHCANYNNGLFPTNAWGSNNAIITETPNRYSKRRQRPSTTVATTTTTSTTTTTTPPPTTTTTTTSTSSTTTQSPVRKKCWVDNGRKKCKVVRRRKCKTQACRERRRRRKMNRENNNRNILEQCRSIPTSKERRQCIRRIRRLQRQSNANSVTTTITPIANTTTPTRLAKSGRRNNDVARHTNEVSGDSVWRHSPFHVSSSRPNNYFSTTTSRSWVSRVNNPSINRSPTRLNSVTTVRPSTGHPNDVGGPSEPSARRPFQRAPSWSNVRSRDDTVSRSSVRQPARRFRVSHRARHLLGRRQHHRHQNTHADGAVNGQRRRLRGRSLSK